MSWKDVAPYLRISVRTLERRQNELNLTVSSKMGKLFYCKNIFLSLSLGLIRLCVMIFRFFLCMLVKWDIGSVIIVFVSCVILTAILMSNPLNCVFTIFLRRNMHLKLYYCMEFSWDQYASCSIILLGGSKPPLK